MELQPFCQFPLFSRNLEIRIMNSNNLLDRLLIDLFSVVVEIGTVNPNVLLELFSMYRDWQEEKAQKISARQVSFDNY